jgi:two-component system cell cycle sensor histidine kinase/response regulator CckA
VAATGIANAARLTQPQNLTESSRMKPTSSSDPKVYDLEARAPAAANLLLVDDEGDFTAMLTAILQASGYLVTVVDNAADGIKTIMERDFDAIICDMMMPGLPGDMFYFAVERTKPHLARRFILITGFKGDAKIEAFLKQSKAPVLYKPFKSTELLDLLSRLLGRPPA